VSRCGSVEVWKRRGGGVVWARTSVSLDSATILSACGCGGGVCVGVGQTHARTHTARLNCKTSPARARAHPSGWPSDRARRPRALAPASQFAPPPARSGGGEWCVCVFVCVCEGLERPRRPPPTTPPSATVDLCLPPPPTPPRDDDHDDAPWACLPENRGPRPELALEAVFTPLAGTSLNGTTGTAVRPHSSPTCALTRHICQLRP
jgi:hypothetical protein